MESEDLLLFNHFSILSQFHEYRRLFVYNLNRVPKELRQQIELYSHKIEPLPPFGITLDEQFQVINRTNTLFNEVSENFYNILNAHHKENHSRRFWDIFIGHWLQRTICGIVRRQFMLERFAQNHKAIKYINTIQNYSEFVPINSSAATYKWNDVGFDAMIVSYLAGQMSPPLIESTNNHSGIATSMSIEKSVVVEDYARTRTQLSRKFKLLLKLSKNLQSLSRDNDALFIGTYLPPKEHFLTQILLGQIPQLWILDSVIYPNRNIQVRRELELQISIPQNNLHENVLKLLIQLIPVSYLEGYQHLKEVCDNSKWPKNPRFIFTSNYFDCTEIFQLWTATKTAKGIPYYVGQHGCNYGTNANICEQLEMKTADKFITWGWKNELTSTTPAFNLKMSKKIKNKNRGIGHLLYIQKPWMQNCNPMDSAFELDALFKNHESLLKNLDKEPKENLLIRLHPAFKKLPGDDQNRWRSLDGNLRFEEGIRNVDYLMKKSKLVVHGYYSTGLLECITLDIPTLCFLEYKLDMFNSEAFEDHQNLVKVGICHESMDSLTSTVNEIWNNPEKWWRDTPRKRAIENFSIKYAKRCNFPSLVLSRILK